jgi:AcrR family transcriptional regulator
MSTPKFSRLDPVQRRQQILDAANMLFAEHGYDQVGIDDIARTAGVTRGLVHHYFGGRKEVYLALVERIGRVREDELRPPIGDTGHERVADSVTRWLDWTQANRTIWLATMAPSEDVGDDDIRRVVSRLVSRAVALLALYHSDIAEDTPRLRYALECWTGLNRVAVRRWLRGEATRELTHEILTSTLEHVLRTFGAPVPEDAAEAPQSETAPEDALTAEG